MEAILGQFRSSIVTEFMRIQSFVLWELPYS